MRQANGENILEPAREVPERWVMGQGAGIAAALSVRDNVPLSAVPAPELQSRLCRQGAIVDRPSLGSLSVEATPVTVSRTNQTG